MNNNIGRCVAKRCGQIGIYVHGQCNRLIDGFNSATAGLSFAQATARNNELNVWLLRQGFANKLAEVSVSTNNQNSFQDKH